MKNFYRRRKPFTQISNEFVQSNKISSKAKIVMNVMQSLPDNWKYSVNGLKGYFKEGKNFIRTGIIELEELGYLVRIQLQKEHGKFGQNIYIMDDEVVTVDYIVEVLIENEITSYEKIYELLTDRGFNTTIEEICAILEQNGIEVDLNDVNTSFSPLSTFPSTVNPMTENSTLINNIIINNIKTNIKSSQSKSNCKLTQENENNSQNDLTDLTDKAGSFDKSVRKGFEEQISFNKLIRDKPEYKDQLCALTGIASELLAQKHQGSVRIMGQEKSLSEVKEKYSRLRYEHILRLLDVLNARLRDGKVPENPVPYIISMLFTVVDEHDVTAFIRAAPKQDSMDHSFDLNEYKALVNQFD